MDHSIDQPKYRDAEPAEQPLRTACDRVEHRRCIRWRRGDYLQDFGGRGLPLQRLLRLVEQPRVLDRDHGLIGERLDNRALSLRKTESGLRMGKDDRADT